MISMKKAYALLGLMLALTPAASWAQAPLEIVVGPRQGTAVPFLQGMAHTGGGNIGVSHPSPDTVIISMTGVAVAGGHICKNSVANFEFDLVQDFEVVVRDPKITKVKLLMAGRVIGLLRSQCCCNKTCGCRSGAADMCTAHASLAVGEAEVLAISMPPRSVAGGENLSINDHEGPVAVPVEPGKYTLHQVFGISAAHGKTPLICKTVSAEFGPAPALDPNWISRKEPFHGADKSSFGFQILLKIVPE